MHANTPRVCKGLATKDALTGAVPASTGEWLRNQANSVVSRPWALRAALLGYHATTTVQKSLGFEAKTKSVGLNFAVHIGIARRVISCIRRSQRRGRRRPRRAAKRAEMPEDAKHSAGSELARDGSEGIEGGLSRGNEAYSARNGLGGRG